MTVMEKLLVPEVSRRIVEQGYDALVGPVYRAEDLLGLAPGERVRAHGLDGPEGPFAGADHVDVLRFETNPLMDLRTPRPDESRGPRPWPTYDLGFLSNAAPVWLLTMTRAPVGARYLRIDPDGTEREFSVFEGAAWGWRRAKGYFPPLHLIGPRVRWQGLDLPASYDEQQQAMQLVWVGDQQVPPGFTPARPRMHERTVPLGECDEVFEIAIHATWRDEPVRVLQRAGDEALLLLRHPTEESVSAPEVHEVEPGLFEATVPARELSDVQGVRTDPVPAHHDDGAG